MQWITSLTTVSSSSGPSPSAPAARRNQPYLVEGAELFSVGGEGEEAVGSIHQTADLQPVITAALTGIDALAAPNHVAVTALDAARHTHTVLYNLQVCDYIVLLF